MSESCDEYADIYEIETRKARKEHVCCACGRTIRKGDVYRYTFVLFDGMVSSYKRCGPCDFTWQHLKRKCDEANKSRGRWDMLHPREDLSCGLKYEDEWGALPDDIAALAFVSDEEAGRLLRAKGD